MAELKKGSRITGADREKLAERPQAQVRLRVEHPHPGGEKGRSYGFVHRILSESGAPLRGRGGATRGAKATT